jgi:hypothetical protein
MARQILGFLAELNEFSNLEKDLKR